MPARASLSKQFRSLCPKLTSWRWGHITGCLHWILKRQSAIKLFDKSLFQQRHAKHSKTDKSEQTEGGEDAKLCVDAVQEAIRSPVFWA